VALYYCPSVVFRPTPPLPKPNPKPDPRIEELRRSCGVYPSNAVPLRTVGESD